MSSLKPLGNFQKQAAKAGKKRKKPTAFEKIPERAGKTVKICCHMVPDLIAVLLQFLFPVLIIVIIQHAAGSYHIFFGNQTGNRCHRGLPGTEALGLEDDGDGLRHRRQDAGMANGSITCVHMRSR